jgi:hypothetical protein
MTALAFSITKGQKYLLTASPQDDTGQPAALVSAPTWGDSDPGVATIEPSADGLSCLVTGLVAGTVVIRADAVGATPLEAEADGTVTAPLATQLVLTGALVP